MIDGIDSGKLAMFVSWAAFALTGYIALAGAPLKGIQLAVLLITLAVIAAGAAFYAVDRGYRAHDGTLLALVIGVLVGLGRRSVRRTPNDDAGPTP